MKKYLFLIVFIIAASIFPSCGLFGSKAPVRHYYQIYYKPKPILGRQISGTVRIRTFDVDKIYRRHNLLFRTSPYEIFYYNTHFWASRPADMVTDLILSHVKEVGLFSEVIVQLDKRPDYVLTGRILALDEIDSDDIWFARVSMIFELKDYKTSQNIITHSFDRRKEVVNQKQVYVVRAMGEILEEETEVFFNKIYEKLNID
jgi:ABC-type uncharacterized transport system auxiliary subunit